MFFKRAKRDKKKTSEPRADEAAGEGASPPEEAASKEASAPEEAAKPVEAEAAPDQTSSAVEPDSLGFATTADIEPADGALGQARALDAIAFASGIKGPDYNILITGRAESGHRAAARAKLQGLAGSARRPADWIYLSYFDSDGGYRALKLAPGTAKAFAEAMAQAIDRLADALPAAFAADDYELKRRAIDEEFRFGREDALEALRREAEAQNIALLRTPAGIAVAPILEGKVVRSEVFNSVPESLRREVQTKISALEAEIEQIVAERPGAEKARRERLLALNEQIAGHQVRAALDELKSAFADATGMEIYLKAAARDLVRNAWLFLNAAGRDGVKVPVGTIGDVRFSRYRVHVMATSEAESGAPLVEEPNPTYANLFGRIELGAGHDGRSAQVTRIRPGALQRANGGFLLLDARALLSAPEVIDALVRALEAQEIRFDPPAEPIGIVGGEIPDLEPIPLNVKLIVFGDEEAQSELAKSRPQLKRFFKVEAAFDDVVERSSDSINAFARMIAGIVAQNDLKPVDAEGVAKLIEEAGRKAGANGKLSLEIGHIADLCREADHWARSEGREITSAADVERVLKERNGREGEDAPAKTP